MDRKILHKNENKILIGLVDFLYETGYSQLEYLDDNTGGIYENKLAHTLGFDVTKENMPAPEFIIASQMLEAAGLVRRNKRSPDVPIMGIWPTRAGLARVEYLKSNWIKKLIYNLKDDLRTIIVSIITTIITLLLSYLFGIFQ